MKIEITGDQVTIEMTRNQAESVLVGLYGRTYGSCRQLWELLTEALHPKPKCCVIYTRGGRCYNEGTHTWKVTCIRDKHRTMTYCDAHGGDRERVESLTCRPCKLEGWHHSVVGVGEVGRP